MISSRLNSAFKIFHRIMYPPKCLVCGRFFRTPHGDSAAAEQDGGRGAAPGRSGLQRRLERLLAGCLCPICIRGLTAVESPICNCCGLPFKSRRGSDHRCGGCITEPKYFRIARAPLVYEEILTQVIHCFKYKGKLQLADPLAELLLTTFRSIWGPDGIDIIAPVPLHIGRFRKRGFNQAYMLIRSWTRLAGQDPYRPADIRIERDLLTRTVATAPQTSLGRATRAVNIKKVFDLTNRDRVIDKRILLIDDVYTTGATVNECARLMMKYGARHVDVLTLARAV
jgi:ComF family protein